MLNELPIVFHSQGVPLIGRFFRNTTSWQERQPAIITMGSWLTVKEQMATTYARRFAELGYTAFVFDFAGFGESRGDPRQTEIPLRKIGDIAAAVSLLRSVGFVDRDRIGCLAICASAQYALQAVADGTPIRSFVSVAGWYHDPASVAPFYGGDAGVKMRLDRGQEAAERFVRSGEVRMVPAYKDGDDRAGMYFPLDYYARPDRGAIPAWRNEMDEMTWIYWLTYDGLAAARRVEVPTLFVHSDGCVFPDHVRRIHEQLNGPKEIRWVDGNQIDFYDQPAQVDAAVNAASAWFSRTLQA